MAAAYYSLVCVLLLTGLVSAQWDMQQPPIVDGINHICPNLLPLLSEVVQNPFLCAACENVIDFLKNVTNNKQLLDDLVNLLLPLCDWAPYALRDQCIADIKDIPAVVANYTRDHLNPKTDCAFVCAASRNMHGTDSVPMVMNMLMMLKDKKPVN